MESKGNMTVTGIPRWACPWAAGGSGMHKSSVQNYEFELSSVAASNERTRQNELPKNAQRRIQRIGFAATGVAATVWLLGVWQIIN